MLDRIFHRHRHPDINRIDQTKFENFPDIPLKISPLSRSLTDLPLGELESVLFLQDLSLDEVAKHFRVDRLGLEKIRQRASDTLIHKRRENSKNPQHARPTVYGSERAKPYLDADLDKITLPPPRTEDDKALARRIFEKVKRLSLSEDEKKNTKQMLDYFYENHRARDGHVFIKDPEAGKDFILWCCKLDQHFNITVNVKPKALPGLPREFQIEKWNQILSRFSDRILVKDRGGLAGRKYRSEIGTAFVKFRAEGSKEDDRSYPIRYALTMAYILFTALPLDNSIGEADKQHESDSDIL